MSRPEEFLFTEDRKKALSKLKTEGRRGHIIAGGTGFYELVKRGYVPEVKSVVSIMKLGLSYINTEAGHLHIGSTTTLQNLLDYGFGRFPALESIDDALKEIRPVQVRNVATIGGEVCISVPIVDLPTALLACNAFLVIMNEEKEFEMKLEDFYIDAFLTKLKYGELVKEVILPSAVESGARSAFVKFGRTAYDFNLINCAVSLSLESTKSRTLKSIRIIIGGIRRTPIRALDIEKKLLGKVPDERTILDACQFSFSKLSFLPSVHGSSEYKHAVLPIIVRDCIMKAFERTLRNV